MKYFKISILIFFLLASIFSYGKERCIKKKGKILMVIAYKYFRDEEYAIPREILEKNGWEVTVASWEKGTAVGMLGKRVKVDLELEKVNPDEYFGVIFVGGIGTVKLFDNKIAHKIAKEFYRSQKIIGAICFGPVILARSGILKGKKATCFYTKSKELEKYGAKYTGKSVEIDGRIITANGPKAAKEFVEKFIQLLKIYEK